MEMSVKEKINWLCFLQSIEREWAVFRFRDTEYVWPEFRAILNDLIRDSGCGKIEISIKELKGFWTSKTRNLWKVSVARGKKKDFLAALDRLDESRFCLNTDGLWK